MLSIKNISKTFSAASDSILQGVTLKLHPGESLAILGDSGSGKSTFLNIISGLVAPSQGKVILGEESLYELKPKRRDKIRLEKFGLVFQQFNLIECLSTKDNITLPARYLNYQYEERLDWLAHRLGITECLNKKVTSLSGGQQQRVAIARALINRPKFVFADEPTGNLDSRSTEKVADLLFDCTSKENTGLIVVTHSDKVAARADTVLRLVNGTLVP